MDKVAIVTGGAKGIGLGSAQRLLEDGASVVVFDVDEKAIASAQELFAAYGDRFSGVKVDISSDAQVKNAVNEVGNKHGHINYLVNSAGIQTYGTAEDTSEELWDRTFGVNVKAMYLTSKYAIPFMRKAKGGSIVNISSVQALSNQTNVLAYASKSTECIYIVQIYIYVLQAHSCWGSLIFSARWMYAEAIWCRLLG
jgi:NAD(P)-dependent dehydrogenase (short-subunit alcohol dehydrogenase family)